MKQKKRVVFYVITIATPVVFFVLLELALRLFDYGDSVPDAFISDNVDTEYMIMNPAVGERYFPNKDFATVGAYDLFLKTKPTNGLRVFVQGASSSAGFPYNHSGSFPRLLEQKLQHYFPEKAVEVVNTSLTATNSFTLLDLSDEIIEQSPDAIVIYSGHNEYYGALGVGSSQSFGKSPMVTNFYLKLKGVKLIQLVRNIVRSFYSTESKVGDQETLMAKMVANESIPFNSETYYAGIEQYKTNIDLLLNKYKEAGIPVFICSLVSNVKDFEPFESADGEYSAMSTFNQGREQLKTTPTLAKNTLSLARDYDLLKFRAPSAIEEAIDELAKEHEAVLIDVKAAFEANSQYGIVGEELLLEHVHPNLKGQRILANSVFDGLKKWLNAQGVKDSPQGSFKYLTSEVDSLFGHTLLNQLLNNWPFSDKAGSGTMPPATNDIERMITGELPWVAVMNSTYTQQINSNPAEAIKTAKVLLQEYPHQVQPYLMVAEAMNKAEQNDEAESFLASIPSKLINTDVISLRLSNLLSMNAFEEALPVARKLVQLQNIPQNQYTVKAITDALSIDLMQLNRQEVLDSPSKFIGVLGALFYLKKTDLAKSYYDQLVKIIPQNTELQQLAKTIQFK